MTPAKVKENLRKKGISLRQFCTEKNLPYKTAVAVLNGSNKGHFGKAHEVAVALGLKEAA
ncbi:DNA-binding protein [Methylophilus sp. DW102]|uniref:DNA-binding protein n=1 Tax=Methylophilus sp. DW102 TaxID=3095607 RepID=UPI00308F04EE|nr:DNA-binding protein [Methylophilus sp. DW102]